MTSPVLVLPENTLGRDFVVGDIHGAFDLLDQALLAVGFDPEKDRLISVGDLIDRGPRSADCLQYLAQPWFYSIRGNHEDLFLYLYKDGKLNVKDTIRAIPAGTAWLLKETDETLSAIYNALKGLPRVIEIQTSEGPVGFVHGDIPSGINWQIFKKKIEDGDKTIKQIASMGRDRITKSNDEGVDGVKRVFFGHTPVEGGPKALGNCFYIDTGAVFKVMDSENKQDFYMVLADIKANAEDICNPAPTEEKLIRTATKRSGKEIPPHPPPA